MSLWICPLCGKQNSIRHYDPTNFVDDILIIRLRGLGKGKSFEEVKRYSLLDGSDPELLDLISDRVAVIYNMLYEDVEDDEAEEGDEETEDYDEEPAQPMTELDREIQICERELQNEEEEEDEETEDDDEEYTHANADRYLDRLIETQLESMRK